MDYWYLNDPDESYPRPRPHPYYIPKGHKGCVQPRRLGSRQGNLPLRLRRRLHKSLPLPLRHLIPVYKPHPSRRATKYQFPNPWPPDTLETKGLCGNLEEGRLFHLNEPTFLWAADETKQETGTAVGQRRGDLKGIAGSERSWSTPVNRRNTGRDDTKTPQDKKPEDVKATAPRNNTTDALLDPISAEEVKKATRWFSKASTAGGSGLSPTHLREMLETPGQEDAKSLPQALDALAEWFVSGKFHPN